MPLHASDESSRRARPARALPLTVALLLAAAAVASAHDMFVKPERFRVAEGADVLVRLVNGTFTKSENSIARDRLADVSVVSPAGRARVDTAAWSVAGDTSTFRVRTAGAGTYVIGVSTRPNIIGMSGAQFAAYLKEDGIPDELARRRREGTLADSAHERYSKHVKALLQVGATPSDDYATVLGYPAEIVPLANPYALKPGATLRVRLLVDGAPARDVYVQYGGRTAAGARIAQRGTRSDGSGIARIPLAGRGPRYVKFISMARTAGGDAAATHESRWATLTFEVR
jgi:uncharacterized GH25 family protein